MIIMNKERLRALFEGITPDAEQKSRMKQHIWQQLDSQYQTKHNRSPIRRLGWLVFPAISLIFVLTVILNIPFGSATPAYAINLKIGEDMAVFRLADRGGKQDEHVTSVSYVDSRPGLEFYIEGDNIAKIHITTDTEYIYAEDFTKTQHEKYWNIEYYQYFDEERQISIADFSLLYDKELTMVFDEQFRDYDQIWYRWKAWDMYRWAASDNFSGFYGFGHEPKSIDYENLSEQEKLEIAAGENQSSIGHMNLEGYPEHLKEDLITITITDRQGNETKRTIHVKVDNNELGQTVVTASLGE